MMEPLTFLPLDNLRAAENARLQEVGAVEQKLTGCWLLVHRCESRWCNSQKVAIWFPGP